MVGLYPSHPMHVMTSVWEASDWVTLNGLVRVDWAKGPFVAEYKDLGLLGCVCEESTLLKNVALHPCSVEGDTAPWDLNLSPSEENALTEAIKLFRTYSWSRDGNRWGQGYGLYNATRENLKNVTRSHDSCNPSIAMTENCVSL